MPKDIRVHIDTLEYTRAGLKTKKRISLEVGHHNRIVLVRPERAPSIGASYGGFAANLSFPGPAVLSMLLHEHVALDGRKTLAERLQSGSTLRSSPTRTPRAQRATTRNSAIAGPRA